MKLKPYLVMLSLCLFSALPAAIVHSAAKTDLVKELGLSADQKKEFRKIRNEYRGLIKPLQEQRKAMPSMKSLDKGDPSYKKHREQRRAVNKKIRSLEAERDGKINKLLSAPQQAKYKEINEKQRAKWTKKGKKGKEGKEGKKKMKDY